MRLTLQDRLCLYHLSVWSNFNFLHNSQWITFPTQSCLVLYSFCANLLHSLIMWVIVSSLSPHNLHLLFCYVLSIPDLKWLVLIPLFCAAIRRDSVFLFGLPFLSYVQVFLWTFQATNKRKWFRLFVAWNVHTINILYNTTLGIKIRSLLTKFWNQKYFLCQIDVIKYHFNFNFVFF